MVRRAGTIDPVLSELRAEIRGRLPALPAMPQRDIDRRRGRRADVSRPARLRVGPNVVPGSVLGVSIGGIFLHALLLFEPGERGQLEVPGADPVPVRVAWVRGASHPLGMGVGLAFEPRDATEERHALELVLTLLDPSERDAANDA